MITLYIEMIVLNGIATKEPECVFAMAKIEKFKFFQFGKK